MIFRSITRLLLKHFVCVDGPLHLHHHLFAPKLVPLRDNYPPGRLLCAPVISLLLLCATAHAQQVLGPGNVTSVNIQPQEVRLATQNGYACITAYSPSVIRVRMDKQAPGRDFSYAVVAKPAPFTPRITQNAEAVTVETESLTVRIAKKPFAITFSRPDGTVINADEPGLGTSWIGEEVTTYKTMQEGERFIGLGEKTGNLDRRGNAYTNWNTDAYGYTTGQDPIYATIPFYIGVHHGMSYGIFFDNTFRSYFNFGASNNRFSSFGAAGGEMNYYFIYHKDVAGIVSSYTGLTGRMPMPPLWSLGYQQNRYSYYPDTEVYRIAQTLREKQVPADGITLDIHYMDAYKLFTWNSTRFPDPAGMNARLGEMGFKTTVIVDPGIKVEKGYHAYESGLRADVFIKYSDGQPYTGQVWPGWCHFPDFTGAKGREWWQQQIRAYANAGVSGLWNDMNEIATWGQHMPNNVLFNFEGQPVTHLQAHNVYGLQMIRASYEGARSVAPNKRPFILTRAGYAGLQRYAAIWTGDNRSEEDHMLLGVRLLNSLGLSGVPFSGMDIGGFTGNPTPSLYARWMQIGAFIPYCRSHTGVNTKSAEPWAFGEEVLEICRNYINLRYRLLPYLYASFYTASQTGLPVMRTLALTDTHDPRVYDARFQNQFCFGPSILVAPFESRENYAPMYFPKGRWYSLYDDAPEEGGREKMLGLSFHQLPVYVRESSIIPTQSLVQHTGEKPADTLFLHIYNGAVKNGFEYYEDDGETYDYEKEGFYKRLIRFEPGTLTLEPPTGRRSSRFRHIQLILHGFEGQEKITVNGREEALQQSTVAFIQPISRFDPQGEANPEISCKVRKAVIPNGSEKIIIHL
ncbi:glycoside hydrolase family 31 [Chitinophaga alhagiae]|uniref:Glycoside hydrolase family 31 n=1 Tax=Chitinophaga alhagiae TaxID=2203219 RepID=A0ABM6WBT1_9BACT|nr:glycoside hydrolase family 31 protein [Chitinophaga alhagiae]AWO01384.1 glycoside hydrolase family 31 [Chitinophaga alhagiae]